MIKQSTILKIVFTSLLLLIPVDTLAGEVTLAWDSNDEADLAGYRLYMQEGAPASGYSFLTDMPLSDIDPTAPSYSVFDLEADTPYYFVITAYNANGDESGFSNSVCVINGQQCSAAYSTSSSGGCFLETLNTPFAWKIPAPAH
jgi:hypothetical protein